MLSTYWPLYDLRLTAPDVTLRYPTEADLGELAAEAARGIHEPDFNPFSVPWATLPTPELERGLLQFHWRSRGGWAPEKWDLVMAVEHQGQLIGTQSVQAEHFAQLGEVATGSWIGRRWQGRGLGKQMRAAVLHLAFEGLGAGVAHTDARVGNGASIGVTRSLGYEPNGTRRLLAGEEAQESVYFRLTRERWVEHARDRFPIEMHGLAACLPLFGVAVEEPR